MDLSSLIGYPKEEVLIALQKENITYNVIDMCENKFYDTELFVKFEYINNILTLYFDKFKLNIQENYGI